MNVMNVVCLSSFLVAWVKWHILFVQNRDCGQYWGRVDSSGRHSVTILKEVIKGLSVLRKKSILMLLNRSLNCYVNSNMCRCEIGIWNLTLLLPNWFKERENLDTLGMLKGSDLTTFYHGSLISLAYVSHKISP